MKASYNIGQEIIMSVLFNLRNEKYSALNVKAVLKEGTEIEIIADFQSVIHCFCPYIM